MAMLVYRCIHCQTHLGEYAPGVPEPVCPHHPDAPAEVFDDGDPDAL